MNAKRFTNLNDDPSDFLDASGRSGAAALAGGKAANDFGSLFEHDLFRKPVSFRIML
jgi:hypothetical protein